MRTRLLLVDDHDWFRQLAVATLRTGGFDVVGQAGTAAEAVRAAHELRPELVLLDIALPDGDGFTVADRLAELDAPPVVVLISSRTRDDYGDRLVRPSVAGFLSKDDLTPQALSALLAGRA
jgi:DNA-binding NarL/FixJ family response regulator